MGFQHFYIVLNFYLPVPWACLVLYWHVMKVPCEAEGSMLTAVNPELCQLHCRDTLEATKNAGEGHFPPKFLSAWVTQGLSHKVFKNSEQCSSTQIFSLIKKKKNHTFLGFTFSNCLAWDRMSRGLDVRGNCGGARVPALFTQEQAQLGWALNRWLLMSKQQL